MKNNRCKLLSLGWLLSLAAALVFVIECTHVEFDLLALFPSTKTERITHSKKFLDDSGFSRQFIVLLDHSDENVATEALKFLRREIKESNLPIIELDFSSNAKEFKEFFKKIYPHKGGLLSEKDRKRLLKHNGVQIKNDAIERVFVPFGLSGPVNLKNDPFFLYPNYVEFLRPSAASSLVNKKLVVFYGQITDPLFSLKIQQKISGTLKPIIEKLPVSTLSSGAIFYASAGAEQAQKETTFIGIASTVSIILLLILIFRAATPLVFAVSVIISGLIGGIFLTSVVYKKIHIISLVFGGSLIGVCVDYALHYYCATYYTDLEHKKSALNRLLPALPLSVFSSCLGYGILTFLPFPGIQQMALMAAGGLFSAFVSVTLFGPVMICPSQRAVPFASKVQAKIIRLAGLIQSQKSKNIFVGSMICLSTLGILKLEFDDNVRHFQGLDKSLQAQETQLKSKLHIVNSPTFFLIRSNSEEELLQQQEKIGDELERHNISHRSLSQIIPSLQRQKENYNLIQKELYSPYKAEFFEHIGVRMLDDLIKEFNPLLHLHKLPQPFSPLEIMHNKKNLTARVIIENQGDHHLLHSIARKFDGIDYINPIEEYSKLFTTYRELMQWVLVGIFVILFFLTCFFKSLTSALSVSAPVLCAICMTLAGLSACGISISLFHIMGLLLVLCIGIDYAFFLYWSDKDSKNDFSLLANAASAITTILSFGLLALSETNAVHSFGLTLFIGISLNFILTTLYLGKNSNAQ